jgi:transcriptional regulator GlxA family with amidase domain
MLPRVLKLRLEDGAVGDWMASSFRFGQEMTADRNHSALVLGKVAELLFIEAVRRFIEALPGVDKGWLAGLQDPVIRKALALLHSTMERRWTTQELAHEVGLSRSAFAERFSLLVGEPPMRYLAQWRMQHAAQRLRDSRDSITTIAAESGYESEQAFSRAFSREYGQPPASWRKQGG